MPAVPREPLEPATSELEIWRRAQQAARDHAMVVALNSVSRASEKLVTTTGKLEDMVRNHLAHAVPPLQILNVLLEIRDNLAPLAEIRDDMRVMRMHVETLVARSA
jgi:hypothetical protein